MAQWMMIGLIFWLVLIALTGIKEGNIPLAVYGLAGAVLNVAILFMSK